MEIGIMSMAPPASSAPSSIAERNGPKKTFLDILFDVILIEKATGYRAVVAGSTAGTSSDHVSVTFKELSEGFRIAEAVCRDYHRNEPTHSESAAMEMELTQAELSDDTKLRNYIDAIGYKNGIFLHRHDTQQSNSDLSEEHNVDSSFRVVIPDAGSLKRFNLWYSEILPCQQSMIARIVFSLRQELWNQIVQPKDLDRHESNAIFRYVPRYFKMRGRTGSEPSGEMSRINSTKTHMAAIETQLVGLKISNGSHNKTTYGLQGELPLPTVEPTSEAYDSISTSMIALYQRLVPSREVILARARLLQKLQRLLDLNFPGDNLRLVEFGSCASGLGSETSDADLCITTTTYQKLRPYNNMRTLATVLRRGGMINVQPILGARVPIVKFVDPVSKINCDINTGRVLGIYNSELIRCYTLIDDRVRPFLYNLKALVNMHRINDSSQSFLSSYAYEPPILPALQAQPQEFMTPLHVKEESDGQSAGPFDCTFDKDISRHKNFGAANTKSVGQLLIEFFEYYTRYFDYQTMEVNVRLGGVRVRDEIARLRLANEGTNKRRSLPQPGKGEKHLIVKDPFIRDRNVAGSCRGRHLVKVWKTFERIYLTLSKGEFKAACESIPEYYFGRSEEEFHRGSGRSVATTAAGSRRPRENRTVQKKQQRMEQKARSLAAPASSTNQISQQKAKLPISTITTGASTAVTTVVKGTNQVTESSSVAEIQTHGPQSKSKMQRGRRVAARNLHNGQVQASGVDTTSDTPSSGAPAHVLKKKSMNTAAVKSQLSQSVPQVLETAVNGQKTKQKEVSKKPPVANGPVSAASSSKISSSNSKEQKQQLQQAFPILEKTRKLLLQSKKSESGESGTTVSTSAGSNSGSTLVKAKRVSADKPPVVSPAVKNI
ncbi:hypothetical protein BGX27_001706 [Mortierella sp. AM989]|nr:hypothetical protein BGX27_001706 [Mortierella sp. AM989]